MKYLICVALLLLTMFTGCSNIADVESDNITQELLVNTWYSEFSTFNAADTSYKYYDVIITIEKVLNRDDYPGAYAEKLNYSYQVGKLLHMKVREQLVSGSMGIAYAGFLYDQVDNYDSTMSYTFSNTLTSSDDKPAYFTKINSTQDTLLIQFEGGYYKATLEKSNRQH